MIGTESAVRDERGPFRGRRRAAAGVRLVFANALVLVAIEVAAIGGVTIWEPLASAYLIWTVVTAFALMLTFIAALGSPGRLRTMLAAILLGAAVTVPPLVMGYAVARDPERHTCLFSDVPYGGLTTGSDVISGQVICRFTPGSGAAGEPVERRVYLLDLFDRRGVNDRVR